MTKSTSNAATITETEDVPRVPQAEFDRALHELQSKFRKRTSLIELFDMPRYGSAEPIQIGVNWCACGTVCPEKAREFTAMLEEATRAAEEFPYNGHLIEREAMR